jgi:hypothetical protein
VNTENEKAMRTLFDEWADKYGLPKEGDLKLVREDCYAAWQAALQSQVSNTDVLEKIVKVADEQPFCSIGHIVEHVVPEIRDALAAPKAPQQVSNTTQDGESASWSEIEVGWLVENGKQGDELRYRTWRDGLPDWTSDPNEATRYCRRIDAERAHQEDIEAWRIAEHAWHGSIQEKWQGPWRLQTDSYMTGQEGVISLVKGKFIDIAYTDGANQWKLSLPIPTENQTSPIKLNTQLSTPPQQQEPSGEVVARMVHDFPALSKFFAKYALGPMTAPSCLCCGRTTKVEDYAVRHAELPGIIICRACKSATETSATPTATASQASREEQMVTLRFDESGKPTVWCDPEIADLVDALNTDNLSTVASCSGHGHRPGRISLKDGRQLLVMNSEQVATVERLFGIDINGASQESAPGQEAVAEVVGVSMLGDNAPLAKHIQTLPGKSVEIGDKLYVAPPTSTAIAAMAFKQAANICNKRGNAEKDLSEASLAAFNLEEQIKGLLPANAEAELEALMMKVAEAVDCDPLSDRLTIVRRVLDEKVE